MSGAEQLYYVISVHHMKRDDPYLLLFNPDCKGYCHRLEVAGKYPESEIAASLDYFHCGVANMAVKCEVLEAMVTPSAPGYLDTPGMVAPNNKAMWRDILGAPRWPTKHKPYPQYRGAPRRPARKTP